MAYRAGEKLTNERDGITHDYTAKQGVEHAEIVLPEGVNADWARIGRTCGTPPSLPRSGGRPRCPRVRGCLAA
jgi:hypothetical protein